MTTREITTISTFYHQNFDQILVLFADWKDTDMAGNIPEYGSYVVTQHWFSGIKAIKNFLSSLGDESYNDILTHFDEIPSYFYYDLLIANTTLSDEVKADICDAHLEQLGRKFKEELVLSNDDDEDLTVRRTTHGFFAYPKFFERAVENSLRAETEEDDESDDEDEDKYLNMFVYWKFGEDFYVRTADLYLRPDSEYFEDNFDFLVHERSWNFIEHYLVPLALEDDGLMWDILRVAQFRHIIPEEFLDRLIEQKVKFMFAYAWFDDLTVEYWQLLQRKIFNRLDTEPDFVARFTYEDALGTRVIGYRRSPISRRVFEGKNIPRHDIIKASFLWQMSSSLDKEEVYDKTGNLYNDFVAQNYLLLLKIFDANERTIEELFFAYAYKTNFYLNLWRRCSDVWLTGMANLGVDMNFWRSPELLRKLRATPELRKNIVQNTHVTLDIIQELEPLSEEEFLILLENPLPVQKALEDEMNIANQADSIATTHFDMDGTPQQRALTALREFRSLYPR